MKDALIICTRSRSNQIDRWLSELATFIQSPSLVVIVDSNSSQQTFEIVKKHKTQSKLHIEYVHSESGLPMQRNNGIEYLLNNSEGELPEIVHFLDDDVSVQSNYFSTINSLFFEFSWPVKYFLLSFPILRSTVCHVSSKVSMINSSLHSSLCPAGGKYILPLVAVM